MVDGDIKKVGVNTLKKGSYVVLDGTACIVSGVSTSRPGKHGHAKVRIVAVGMIDGKKRDVVMPGHDHVDVPILGKRNAQVLSVSGKIANVMDMESFETLDLEVPEELADNIAAGVNILYWVILSDKIMKQIKTD